MLTSTFSQTGQCLVAGNRDKSISHNLSLKPLPEGKSLKKHWPCCFQQEVKNLQYKKIVTLCRLYPQNPNYFLPIVAPKLHFFLQTCTSDIHLNFWALIPSSSDYKTKILPISSVHGTENLLPLLVFHISYTRHFKSFLFFFAYPSFLVAVSIVKIYYQLSVGAFCDRTQSTIGNNYIGYYEINSI